MFVNVHNGTIEEKELQAYIDRGNQKFGDSLEGIDIECDGDEVTLSYTIKNPPFERIRRITGYLVGTMDRWNNAKRAEEKDRVKHSV